MQQSLVYNFFVGKVMQKTNRQANPNMSLDIDVYKRQMVYRVFKYTFNDFWFE